LPAVTAAPGAQAPTRARTSVAAIAVLAAAVVAVAARCFTSSPLWLDEALSANIASLPVGDIFEALRHDGHPPLYYLVLHGWMKVVGDSDLAVRLLSGLLSLATLPLAWMSTHRLGGRRAAQWSVVIVGLSPYGVRYATEARMYSLVMLLVLAGQLLVRRALASGGAGPLAGIALVSGALLLTHYWSLWLLAATGAVLLWRWRRGDRRALPVIGAMAAGGVLFLPWLPGFLDQLAHTGTPWGEPFRPTEAAAVTISDLGGFEWVEAPLLGVLLMLALTVAVFGVRTRRRAVELDFEHVHPVAAEVVVAGLTLLLGASVALATDSTYATRYASVFVPLLLVAAAVGASRLPYAVGVTWGIAVVLLSLGGITVNVVEARTQARDIADAIEDGAVAGDLVAYCPDQLGPAVDRELDAPVEQVTYPALDGPELVDWVDYVDRIDAADPEAFAEEVHRRARGTVWLVLNGSYRTHDGVCEAVANALIGLRRGSGPAVVRADADFFENASLLRFAPTP
jgi:uncharacterized membrane protein